MGTEYELSCHYRSFDSSNYIGIWNGSSFDEYISASYSAGWSTLSGTFTATTASCELWLVSDPAVSDDLYIDNLQIIKTAAEVSAVTKSDVVLNSIRMRWTPYKEIINHISAGYEQVERDLVSVVEVTSATTSTYGVKDGSHKFKLDLVQSSTTAQNVVDGHIARLQEPRRVVEFTSPLSKINVERGDIIAVTHDLEGGWSSKQFVVMETHFIIGSGKSKVPDGIRIIAEEI